MAENTLKGLKKQIEERKKFLNRIVPLIVELVRSHGVVKIEKEFPFHYNIVSELRDFAYFSFITDLGQTDFGGNSLEVYFHPGQMFRQGGLEAAFGPTGSPVLNVCWQDEDKYEVLVFNQEIDWQEPLVRLLKNKDKIAREMGIQKEREKTQRKRDKEAEAARKQEEERIREEAKKLGIIPE